MCIKWIHASFNYETRKKKSNHGTQIVQHKRNAAPISRTCMWTIQVSRTIVKTNELHKTEFNNDLFIVASNRSFTQ